MRYTFTAPHLNSLTFDTLQEYSKKKFSKIQKFLRKDKLSDSEVRISANKVRENFELIVQSFGINKFIIKVKDKDLRKAIDQAVDNLKRRLRDIKIKERRHNKLIDTIQA